MYRYIDRYTLEIHIYIDIHIYYIYIHTYIYIYTYLQIYTYSATLKQFLRNPLL